jgi:hypothetical protein
MGACDLSRQGQYVARCWEHAICPVRDNMLVEDETRRLAPRPRGTECDWSILSTFRPYGTERGGGVNAFSTNMLSLTGQKKPLKKPLHIIYFTLLNRAPCTVYRAPY